MDLNRYSIGIRVEGIPHLEAKKTAGAVFWFGLAKPGSVAADYGLERALVEIPASLDAEADLQTGDIDLQGTTFALSATDSVCRRLMTQAGSVGEPRATLGADLDSGVGTAIVESNDTIEAGDYIYAGDETFYVDAIDSLVGSTYTLSVTRGIAGSVDAFHASGTRVSFRTPYLKWRTCELIRFDLDTGTMEVIGDGLFDGIKTDEDQGELILSVSDTLTTLWGAEGGITTRLDPGTLVWSSSGALNGEVPLDEEFPVDWPNAQTTVVNVMIGDVAYKLERKTGRLVASAEFECWNTKVDLDPKDDGTPATEVVAEDVRPYLAWSRNPDDGVGNDLEGLYGAPEEAAGVAASAHPAAVSLALMLSTGDGTNNLIDPDTQTERKFDVLGSSWAMGVPAKLIDAESWLQVIDEVPATIERIALNHDGSYDFKSIILPKLLIAHDLWPFPTHEGRVGLRHLTTWSVDDLAGVLDSAATVTLSPTKIVLDRRLERYSSVIKAKIGGIAPSDEADTPKVLGLEKTRRDAMLGQTPYERDFSLHDKEAWRAGESGLEVVLQDLLEKSRDNPPLATCSIPMDSAVGEQKLPPVLSWVRLRGGPEGGLIGPDGERVAPADTNITFIGILVGRTWDLGTGDAECRVLLTNWWLGDRVPRLIAPSAKILSAATSSPTIELSLSTPDKYGGHGFSGGDQVKVIHKNGRRWYGDPTGLYVVSTSANGVTLNQALGEDVSSPDELWLELAKVDEYSNASWDGADYGDPSIDNRRYAYFADAQGTLGAAGEDADIYS